MAATAAGVARAVGGGSGAPEGGAPRRAPQNWQKLMCAALEPRQREHTTAGAGAVSGEAMCTTGAPTNGPAGACCTAGSSSPQAEQKRLPAGLLSPQRWHADGARGEKSKSGAGGRERMSCASSASAAAATPRGGVGSATGPIERPNLFPQSWQNRRCSGLSRPQRSHFTAERGTLLSAPRQECSSGFTNEAADLALRA